MKSIQKALEYRRLVSFFRLGKEKVKQDLHVYLEYFQKSDYCWQFKKINNLIIDALQLIIDALQFLQYSRVEIHSQRGLNPYKFHQIDSQQWNIEILAKLLFYDIQLLLYDKEILPIPRKLEPDNIRNSDRTVDIYLSNENKSKILKRTGISTKKLNQICEVSFIIEESFSTLQPFNRSDSKALRRRKIVLFLIRKIQAMKRNLEMQISYHLHNKK